MTIPPGRSSDDSVHTPPGEADALSCAVAAYVLALRLSCKAAREPTRAALANAAGAAHLEARAWAEEAVRRAAYGRAGTA